MALVIEFLLEGGGKCRVCEGCRNWQDCERKRRAVVSTRPACYGIGRTDAEALGDLVKTWPEMFPGLVLR